jgi:hypothetical protein
MVRDNLHAHLLVLAGEAGLAQSRFHPRRGKPRI